MRRSRIYIAPIILLLLLSISNPVRAVDWRVLHSDHFNVHFDRGQQQLVEYILPLMIADLGYIEDRIGYRLSGRIDVFIYPSTASYLGSLKQSPMPRFNGIDGGIIDIRGFDINLCYTGNKSVLLRDLRIGIGENLISEMLYGGTTQERIKYHTLLHLPDWFISGLAEYLALGWDNGSDGALRDLFLNKKLGHFNKLGPEDQTLIGHSLWRYIDERKGDLSIPRILYLVRLTRKLETALYFVFNAGVKEIYADWYRYNNAIYAHELNRRIPSNSEDLRWHIAKHRVGQVFIGSDLNNLVYVMSEPGLTELRIWNRETRTNKVLYSENTNRHLTSIPEEVLIPFWDGGQEIWLADNLFRKGELLKLNLQGAQVESFNHPFTAIRAIAKTEVSNELLLIGVMNGKTDVFLFNTLTERVRQITDDWNDEAELFYDVNGNFYYSAQVYREEYHPAGSPSQSDIFYCIRGVGDSIVISNLTNTGSANERDPVKLSQASLSYLSDANGISNAYLFDMAPPGKAITDYRFSILDQQVSPDKSLVVEMLRIDDHYELFASALESGQIQVQGEPALTQTRKILQERKRVEDQIKREEDRMEEHTTSYSGSYFQTDFPVPANVDSMEDIAQEVESLNWFEFGEHTGYKFRISRIYTQLDNSYFGNDLFPVYLAPEEQFRNPFGATFGVGISDQRQRHQLTTLARSNLSFSSMQFRLNYRFNQGNNVYEGDVWRRTELLKDYQTYYRNRALQMKFTSLIALSDRFNLNSRLRVRRDELMPLSTNREALLMDVERERFAELGAGIEFHRASTVFNGEKQTSMRIDLSGLEDGRRGGGGTVKLEGNIHRPLTPALQLRSQMRSGFAFGNAQRLFMLGGLSEEFRADFNRENPVFHRNTNYYEPIFGMRAFPRNIRNGNSFLLLTNTLELNLSKVLHTHALGSRWLSNTSLLAFADLGSAWFGIDPWSIDNPRNVRQFSDGVLDIRVYNVKSPFAYAFGSGIQTRLYGYSVVYNLGWGFDNGVWNKAVSQIKIGLDF